MWFLAGTWPQAAFRIPLQGLLSRGLGVAGAVICVLGVVAFRRARTTLDPRQPGKTSALVTRGIYARTRNPMYLGFVLLLAGWGLLLGDLCALALPLVLAVYLDRCQIPAEERALGSAFGDEFAAYARRVRRWL
jgi:protein-S-isoprenylcysteine O-methyltransferase Ste14